MSAPSSAAAPRDRRRPSTAIEGIVVIALLALAAAVTVIAPTEDDIQSPIENHGSIGDVVSSRQASVEVAEVTVARAIDLGAGQPAVTTDGAWVAVDLTVVCRLRTCDFAESLLRIGERSYGPATLLAIPSFTALAADAGITYETTALFEIPREALDDGRAELIVQPDRTAALDSRAVVDLALPTAPSGTALVRPTRMVGGR